MDLFKAKQGIPPLELMEKAMIFDISLQNPEEVAALVFFWDIAAPCILGTATWNVRVRRSQTMLETKNKLATEQDLFTPSSLAFIYLAYENCCDKWMETSKWMKDNPGKDLPKKNTKDTPKEQRCEIADKIHVAKYSDCTLGRVDFGGWSIAGKKRFCDLQRKVQDNMGLHFRKIEKTQRDFIPLLQELRKVKEKKGTKRKASLGSAGEQDVDCGGFSDSDDCVSGSEAEED